MTAPLGRIGCDPPLAATEWFLKKMSSEKFDLLVMSGDFVGHYIPLEVNEPDQPELYVLLEQTHASIADLVYKYQPNAIFLPTLGNNDCKYHY